MPRGRGRTLLAAVDRLRQLYEGRGSRTVLVLTEVQGLVRERDFDIAFVEALLDQAVERAAHLPLLDWARLDPSLDYDRRVAELVEAEDLEGFEDQGPDLGVLLQFVADLLDHFTTEILDRIPENTMISIRFMSYDMMIDAGIITDAMFPKVEACLIALETGVKKTHIIDGRMEHACLLEIFTDKGIGTAVARFDQ